MLDYRNHQLDRKYRFRTAGRILFRQLFVGIASCALVFGLVTLWFGTPIIQAVGNALTPDERYTMFGGSSSFSWEKIHTVSVIVLAGMILAQIVLGLLSASLNRLRRRRAELVLSHLTTAVQLRLPIPQYLRAAGRGEALSVRRRSIKLAKAIESGQPIGAALQQTNVEIGVRAIALIDAGERSGSLTETLNRLATDRCDSDQTASQTGMRLAYFISFSTLSFLVTLGYCIFVFPKFQEILRDYNARMDLSYLPKQLPLLLLVMCAPLVLVMILLTLRTSRGVFTSGPGLNLFKWLIDPIIWRLPVIGRIQRCSNYRDTADIIATAAARGFPMDVAIRNAMMPHLNRVMLHRLGRLQQAVEQGVPASSAAHQAKLPEVFVSTLAAPADFAGTMRYVSQLYATQRDRAIIWINAVLPIITTTIFAVMVGWLGFMLFTPMIKIIDVLIARLFNP